MISKHAEIKAASESAVTIQLYCVTFWCDILTLGA